MLEEIDPSTIEDSANRQLVIGLLNFEEVLTSGGEYKQVGGANQKKPDQTFTTLSDPGAVPATLV